MKKQERCSRILDYFRSAMPKVKSELIFSNSFELLVSVILSAQCTDKRINMVTPALFRRFPTAGDLAIAKREDVFEYISSVSYPNAKTNYLIAMSKVLIERFSGNIPSKREELMSLPGVGRKTANVVMAVAFNKPAFAVDTHIFRVSHRLGLVTFSAKTPLKVEEQLLKLIPKNDLASAHHWFLLHGRYVCVAKKPHCYQCKISQWCKTFEIVSKSNFKY